MRIKLVSGIAFFIAFYNVGIAQGTFTQVYDLLQTKCSASGCHGGSNPNVFDVDGSESDVYSQLVGVEATNPKAASKGYKLIDPGHPANSFLLKKIAHGISQDLELEYPFEGADMPNNLPKLPDEDIELVRQWILFGAPDTGQVVDRQLLVDFYNGQGKQQINPIAPPDPSEGFQVHDGPFFLPPLGEKEYYWKYKTALPANSEVTRIKVNVNLEAHHLALYKYLPGKDSLFGEGLRLVDGLLVASGLFYNADVIGQWPNSTDMVLPQGTAFFWPENATLDINYHIKNYSPDSILACELYLNVYYQPRQSNTIEMHSAPIYYGGNNPGILVINNDGQDTTFVMDQHVPGATDSIWNIWSIQAHTHQLGKDFDVWLRNPDGTKGDHIYEGFFNEDYTFDQGFYDWEHPPFKMFDPMLPVDMSQGLIHEATFNNSGPKIVGFGLTTQDEMFVTYMNFTTEPLPTGIKNVAVDKETILNIYPNPFEDEITISYNMTKAAPVKLELFNLLGTRVATLMDAKENTGMHQKRFNLDDYGLNQGVYVVRLTQDGQSVQKKIIRLD